MADETDGAGQVCAVCSGHLSTFGQGRILGDRTVTYLRCTSCGCVQLPHPDWLEEAYSDAISSLDVGLLERCVQLANVTTAVLSAARLRSGTFLDYAGGYGTLTRLMRDRGYDFHHLDPLCENVFAQGFEGSLAARYDLVTAFEVLEHLTDPVASLGPVASTTDLMLVTTELLPDPAPAPGAWDYYAAETGQHVVFYTERSLQALAQRLGMSVTSTGRHVHLFHREPLSRAVRLALRDERLMYVWGALRSEVGRRGGGLARDRELAVTRLSGPRA